MLEQNRNLLRRADRIIQSRDRARIPNILKQLLGEAAKIQAVLDKKIKQEEAACRIPEYPLRGYWLDQQTDSLLRKLSRFQQR